MIIQKTIQITARNNTIGYCAKVYPKILMSETVTINVTDLPPGSAKKVLCLCDYCEKEVLVKYHRYLNSIKEIKKFSCTKCRPAKFKDVCLLRYGVENVSQTKYVQEKRQITWMKNYGVINPSYSKDIELKKQATTLKNFGVRKPLQNKDIHIKQKQTCVDRFGTDNVNSLEETKDKIRKTCIRKYGVRNFSQTEDFYNKVLKVSLKVKQYKDTNLYYQGSYEKYFLERLDENGLLYLVHNYRKGIKYLFSGKALVYFPDFIFKEQIVEIKSSWTYNGNGTNLYLQEKNETKWHAARIINPLFIALKSKQEIDEFIFLLTPEHFAQ